jgi:hypothetical protein
MNANAAPSTLPEEARGALQTRPQEDLPMIAMNSLNRLLAWIENSPAITPDPYDIKAHPWFARRLARRHRFLSRLALKAAYVPAALFPAMMPRLFGIKRQQTPNALAWLALGFLELYRGDHDPKHLQRAEFLLARLKEMRLKNYEEYCWGFPLDWQTATVVIPAGSPLLYTQRQIAQCFYDYYEATQNEESLRVALSTCRCAHRVLNKPINDQSHLCLTYSPYDSMQVFNTNSLAGGLHCRLGVVAQEPDLVDFGSRMLNWVADEQRSDGSWEYFSRITCPRGSAIDHYHTAMTLQGLADGVDMVGQGKWIRALERGLQFYFDRMFDGSGRPKFTPSSTYPIDVMSCAEALILLSNLRASPDSLPAALRLRVSQHLDQLAGWVCRNFQSARGPFYYRGYPGLHIRLFSFRWGQGAMMKALARFLNTN